LRRGLCRLLRRHDRRIRSRVCGGGSACPAPADTNRFRWRDMNQQGQRANTGKKPRMETTAAIGCDKSIGHERLSFEQRGLAA
jgi:hypothetical protein